MEETLSSKVSRRKEDIICRAIAGETILVPVRGTVTDMQRIFSLNVVAGFVWEKLDGKRSLGEIRDEILGTFQVDKEKADADMEEFIINLMTQGLVTESP